MRRDDGACPVNEELAQVGIAALGNSQQALFAPGAVLAWRDPEPRRKAPAAVKDVRITDGGHRGARRKRTDPRNFGCPAACLVVSMPSSDARVQASDLLVQANELQAHRLQRLAQQRRRLGAVLGNEPRQRLLEAPPPRGHHQAKFG